MCGGLNTIHFLSLQDGARGGLRGDEGRLQSAVRRVGRGDHRSVHSAQINKFVPILSAAIELAETQPPLFDLHPMRVLALMTKSSYKPPALKDRIKWSPFFHDFVKQTLTKNPKKRPTPARLLAVSKFMSGVRGARGGNPVFYQRTASQ